MGGRFSIRKLFLDLLVIVCLIVAGWVGYQLFFSHKLEPVMGSIIFIVDIGVLIWNIAVLRNHYYKRMYPSFKMVFLSLLVISIILAFAGVQPLSSYKGLVVDRVASVIDGFKGDTSVDGEVNEVGITELSPPPSSYPADIIGQVIVAKAITGVNFNYEVRGEDEELWIVRSSVKNKTNPAPIEAKGIFLMTVQANSIGENQSHSFPSIYATGQPIVQGESGITLSIFIVNRYYLLPLNPDNFHLEYWYHSTGVLGNLVNTNIRADVYDWDTHTIYQNKKSTVVISEKNVGRMGPSGVVTDVMNPNSNPSINVGVVPNSSAEAGYYYVIDLYEKGELRDSEFIQWNEPELNVAKEKLVNFSLSKQEYSAYYGEDIRSVFSIKVYREASNEEIEELIEVELPAWWSEGISSLR